MNGVDIHGVEISFAENTQRECSRNPQKAPWTSGRMDLGLKKPIFVYFGVTKQEHFLLTAGLGMGQDSENVESKNSALHCCKGHFGRRKSNQERRVKHVPQSLPP